jgi:hypothetical protein
MLVLMLMLMLMLIMMMMIDDDDDGDDDGDGDGCDPLMSYNDIVALCWGSFVTTYRCQRQ